MKPGNMAAAPAGESNRLRFMSLMSEQLSGLYDYVRHALTAREAAGDLEPGDLTPEDAVQTPPHRSPVKSMSETTGGSSGGAWTTRSCLPSATG